MRFDENLPSETDEHFKKCLIAKKKKKEPAGIDFFQFQLFVGFCEKRT